MKILHVVQLNRRKGCYFWLDPKVTKRSRQQQHFFLPHWAFALHIRQHHREAFPCPAVRTRNSQPFSNEMNTLSCAQGPACTA
jgi:hypothetical protein